MTQQARTRTFGPVAHQPWKPPFPLPDEGHFEVWCLQVGSGQFWLNRQVPLDFERFTLP